jgi:hypothetical protein
MISEEDALKTTAHPRKRDDERYERRLDEIASRLAGRAEVRKSGGMEEPARLQGDFDLREEFDELVLLLKRGMKRPKKSG